MTAQATQASAAPSYHVLQYKYVPDILEKRGPFREKHLELAGQKVNGHHLLVASACAGNECVLRHANVPRSSGDSVVSQRDEGKIVLAGALTDPVDTALFIWKNASQEVSLAHFACMRDCYQGSAPRLGRPVSIYASQILLYSVSLGHLTAAWKMFAQEIEQFVKDDVYVNNNLVTDW